MLLEYFIDSIWLGSDGVTIASWFYENGDQMTWERLLTSKEKAPHALPFKGFDMRDVG
ncbi:hypothetical protein [Arcanobacterium phocae]|uniref:hypothetical protein n=1 Tax=Arcanobacterium phocae TaxID=131112 RepID=UPI0012FA016A|nr:hypothetical protein [Arcanobacterium phocae]